MSKIFLVRQSETTNYPTTNEKQIKVKDARQKPRVKMKLFRENSFFRKIGNSKWKSNIFFKTYKFRKENHDFQKPTNF